MKRYKENYVVKNPRLKNYLYTLGFYYIPSRDTTGQQDYIFLFEDTKDLQEAISFYTRFKNKKKG